jgi:hypothetical protein
MTDLVSAREATSRTAASRCDGEAFRPRPGVVSTSTLSRAELVVERTSLPANLRSDAPVTDLGVDRVREARSAWNPREAHDVALRREDEDLAAVEVDP